MLNALPRGPLPEGYHPAGSPVAEQFAEQRIIIDALQAQVDTTIFNEFGIDHPDVKQTEIPLHVARVAKTGPQPWPETQPFVWIVAHYASGNCRPQRLPACHHRKHHGTGYATYRGCALECIKQTREQADRSWAAVERAKARYEKACRAAARTLTSLKKKIDA